MKLVVVVAITAGALVFAGQALADTQELTVTPFSSTPGATADTDIDVFVPTTAAATQKVAVYVPAGYVVNTALPSGTKVGDVDAELSIAGAMVEATGSINADDPAKYATDPTLPSCAPGTHAAVWLATLTAAGQTLSVAVYVDPTTGADTALGAYVLQACFLSPDVPTEQGGALFGARLVDVDLETTGVITNAPLGLLLWRALITSYMPGTATADPASTVEVRCNVPLPHRISGFKVTYLKRKPKTAKVGKVMLTGMLVAGAQPRPGVVVRFVAATTPDPNALKPWASAVTTATGKFTLTKRLPKRLYVFAYVPTYFTLTCTAPSTAPKGCVREDTAPEIGPYVILTPRKR
jgi:hypothetical protein